MMKANRRRRACPGGAKEQDMTKRLTWLGRVGLCGLAALLFGGCATSVEMPKGRSKGYASARFIRLENPARPSGTETSQAVNAMIQEAIAAQFANHGLRIAETDADLIIAYLLIIQDNVSTRTIDEYFGYGRDTDGIAELAQERGVVKSNRPERFEAGAIVIDLLDARTNRLVYRSYARRDMVENVSDPVRRARIDDAVAEALAPFFR